VKNLALQCPKLGRHQLIGVWVRALHPKYALNPTATAHTPNYPSRFSPGNPADPAFEVLYLAENPLVASFEVQALLGSPFPGAAAVPNPAGGPWAIANVDVRLQSVVELTHQMSLQTVGTSVQELTGDWRGYALRNPARPRGGTHGSDVPTQRLGLALERLKGLEGFVSYSARVSTNRILVVFPHKLLPGSSLRYKDRDGKWVSMP
jgi:hypothetical protein